jgi:flagellar biosynthesis repressor protein FlbT
MALKLTLKPQERTILGGAVVRNAGSKAALLLVENEVPVLRERHILSEKEACTPARRLYFSLQLLYVDRTNAETTRPLYHALLQDLGREAPSMQPLLRSVSDAVERDNLYEALRQAWSAIEYEKELFENAKLCPSNV